MKSFVFISLASFATFLHLSQGQSCTSPEENCSEETDDNPISLKPLPLAKVENDNLKVNGDTVFSLFNREELQEKPLSILSIAGATRSGKSFILTFFLRYLRNKGWENPNWFGGDDTEVAGGFRWKKGFEACTKGIDVYPEIFYVPLNDGRKCAVLIVDTQGLFDADTPPDTNSKLMSLSTLVSSHQILNVMRQIEERDLEHLEMCVEIAKLSGNLRNGTNLKAFQSLKFLVRDWEHDDNLGDCTASYLQRYLEKASSSKTVDKTKRSIRDAFDTVRCFLLPRPGENVISKKNILQNKDIGDGFQKHTKELVESILHPDNIVIKRTRDGREATADDLRNLIGSVGKAFIDGTVPEAETMLQSMIRANHAKLMGDAVNAYKEKMYKLIGDKIVNNGTLKEYHSKTLHEVQKWFKSEATMGGEESQKDFLNQLKKECNDSFDSTLMQNELKKKTRLRQLETFSFDLADGYKEGLKQIEAEDDAEFTQEDKQLQMKAIENFEEKASRDDNPLWLISDVKNKLHFRLAKFSKEAQEVWRRHKEVEEEKKKLTEKANCTVFGLKLRDKFDQKAEKRGGEYAEDIMSILQFIKKEVLKEYDDGTNLYSEKIMVEDIRDGLYTYLEDEIEKRISRNEERKESLRKESILWGAELSQKFEREMEKAMSRAYVKPSVFDENKQMLLNKYVYPHEKYQKLPKWGRDLVTEEIRKGVEKLKQRNEENKKYRNSSVGFWGRIFKILKKIGKFAISFVPFVI